MTDENGPPPTIRIPRIGIASRYLNGQNYTGTHFSTLPRNNDIYTSPSYVVDHLPTRRLSEIDKPYYIPTLLSSSQTVPINGYSTTPARRQPEDWYRLSDFPATSQALGLNTQTDQPPSVRIEEPLKSDDSPAKIAENMEEVNLLALFNNTSLAYQRVCYLLSRYPAVALCLISTWMLWGRGLGLKSVQQNENIAYIVSFAGGVFILISQILLSFSHHGSYRSAKVLANFYHFSNLIGLLIAATAIVFSSISYQSVKKVNASLDTCKQKDPTYMNLAPGSCITPSERLVYLSIIIGSSACVILLYFFSGIYGCIGQVQMKEKRQIEYKRYSEAQDNHAFKY